MKNAIYLTFMGMKFKKYHCGDISKVQYQNHRKRRNRHPKHKYTTAQFPGLAQPVQ